MGLEQAKFSLQTREMDALCGIKAFVLFWEWVIRLGNRRLGGVNGQVATNSVPFCHGTSQRRPASWGREGWRFVSINTVPRMMLFGALPQQPCAGGFLFPLVGEWWNRQTRCTDDSRFLNYWEQGKDPTGMVYTWSWDVIISPHPPCGPGSFHRAWKV